MMPEQHRVQVKPLPEPKDVQFKKTVFLAYTDVAAAGSRALLGLNMRKEYYSLEIPEIADLMPACVRDSHPEPVEQDFQKVQILNCKYEQFSAVVVNTVLPGPKCHYVAKKIIDLCVNSKIEKMVILTSLHLPDVGQFQEHQMYENTFNCAPVTSHPPLPGDVKICDPFFSTLIQMIQIELLPCTCLTIPGFKAVSGKANMTDGSKQMITLFQDTLAELTRLRFDPVLSRSLIYKETSSTEEDMAAMMYI